MIINIKHILNPSVKAVSIKQLTPGDMFINVEESGKNDPDIMILTDEGKYVYLNDGAEYDVALKWSQEEFLPVDVEIEWWAV